MGMLLPLLVFMILFGVWPFPILQFIHPFSMQLVEYLGNYWPG